VPATAESPTAAAVHDREALWAAFCAGTGVPIDLPGGVSPEMMHILGQIMINALGGTLRLMAVRANVKQEMRAHMTVIQARSNNPLKFSPDARSGLEQLLKPPMRGFLAGPEAMTDAMHDLVGHSIGTVVGMRAALEGVLGRFEPDALESKLAAKSLLDTVLPMNRKARLWELYLQHFETIRTEAQDDFQALFGKAFLAAYEQQLDRLHDEAAGGSR
jgi:FHA domain-containing protein